MRNPYEVLGIAPNANDEQVKDAYKDRLQAIQEYRFSDSPEAAKAEEDIIELNQAYDAIMIERTQQKGGPTVSYQAGYTHADQNSSNSQFVDVRRLIQANRISEAEQILDGVPFPSRDAEWYFLKGSIQYSRGWLEDAYESFNRAVSMDPSNSEYQATMNQLRWQRQTGSSGYNNTGGYKNTSYRGCSVCDICTTLYCANCCCNCMGSDCC